MIEMYRVEFVRPLAMTAVPESPSRICIACAAGHHDQPMLSNESCDCPCHGVPLEFAGYQVAA